MTVSRPLFPLVNCILATEYRLTGIAVLTALVVLTVLIPAPAICLGANNGADPTFALQLENDAPFGTDENYTSGFKLTWGTPLAQDELPTGRLHRWSRAVFNHLPFGAPAEDVADRALSLSVGQNIYTPAFLDSSELIEGDRPYAAYLYAAAGFHSQTGSYNTVWEFIIGVVGPWAFGEPTQEFAHAFNDLKTSRGWEHQLNNEPALEVVHETKWRMWRLDSSSGLGLDLIPHLGGRLGNVAIYANAGAELRLGWYVPENYGSCSIRPGCDVRSALPGFSGNFRGQAYGIHLFGGVDQRFVLRNIFLDGNTFSDSHSVDKKMWVTDWFAGIAAEYKRFMISYSFVLRSKEFDSQDGTHSYAALGLSYTY
jgi:lipid A 3-O-deacylase